MTNAICNRQRVSYNENASVQRLTILKVVPALLILAIHLVGAEAMHAWIIMMKTVRRKVS